MPSRAKRLVNGTCVAALFLCAHATAYSQQTLTSRASEPVADHSMRLSVGPTVQTASAGVHFADARELQPPRVSPSARTGISDDARRNVVIAAGLLLITACIVGGETGLKLGAVVGLVGFVVAVG